MFTVENTIPWEELEPQIRQTKLLNQPDVMPYAESRISMINFPSQHFDDYAQGIIGRRPVNATTRYVLKQNLAFQDQLRLDLLDVIGCDQLSLVGGLVLRNQVTQERSILAPPIIESTAEDGYYVLDGAHRIWSDRVRRQNDHENSMRYTGYGKNETIALQTARRMIRAVVINDPSVPSYAKPNTWKEVSELEAVPDDPADKKDYRFEYPGGYRMLYRDFSHLGSSGLRSQ